MNDSKKLILLLILFSFFAFYILFPIIRFIVCFVEISKLKKRIPSFGKEIIQLSRNQKISKKMIFIYCIFCAFCICFGIYTKIYLMFIAASTILPMIINFVRINKYTELNGIYENGIVIGSYLDYKDFFSWKVINDNKISILKQDGLRFEFETNNKQKEIIDYFISKGIPEEQ